MATITIKPKDIVETIKVSFKVIKGGKKDDKHGEVKEGTGGTVPTSDETGSDNED